MPQLIANNMSGCFFSETRCKAHRAAVFCDWGAESQGWCHCGSCVVGMHSLCFCTGNVAKRGRATSLRMLSYCDNVNKERQWPR